MNEATTEPTRQEVIERLDRTFAPDLRVKINEASTVIGFTPVTQRGAAFLLESAGVILGANYDQAFREVYDLTIEVIE